MCDKRMMEPGLKLHLKMMRNKYIYIVGIIILAMVGYFYFTKTDNQPQVIEKQQADILEPTESPENIDPKDILKYDPNAPKWMQEAESCTRVGGKIFCKLKGE